jgi:fructoselysine-6-P-deglycase FrlB-like protein
MNTMMKNEIAAQADLLLGLQPLLAAAADALPRAKGRILVGGCGDSAFAPEALLEVFRRLGIAIEPRTSMQLAHFTRFQEDDTVVLSSISGGTKRTVEAADVARANGARVIAVTCNAESALVKASAAAVILPFAPLSRKTPHTLDYAITLLALAEIGRSQAGLPADTLASSVADIAARLAQADAVARPIADAYRSEGRIFFLGAGEDRGTADYAAAKFHEAGGLVAISAESENFVHGMNFMLEPEDTLVVVASSPAAKKRGREIVEAFETLSTAFLLTVGDEGLAKADDASAAFSQLLDQTFTLQYACLHAANRLGLKLEEPRAGCQNGKIHLAAQSRAMES